MQRKTLVIALYSSIFNLILVPVVPSFARIFGYITIVCFLFHSIYPIIRYRKVQIDNVVLGFIFLIFISFLLNLNSFEIESMNDLIDDIISILSFVAFYIALSTSVQEKDPMVLEDIFTANYFLVGMILLYTYAPVDFKYTIVNEYGKTSFTMGLGNPNATSLCVMFSIVVLLIQCVVIKKRIFKLLLWIVIALLTYSLYLLSSRTVLVCLIVVVAFYIVRSPKLLRFASYFVLLAPFLLFVAQISLLKENISIEILGKALDTGRPEMYDHFLKIINDNTVMLVCGNLSEYMFYNAHNGMLSLMVSLGSLGVVLYLLFWNRQLGILRGKSMDICSKIAFATIMAFLIHTSSESMSVLGTIPYSMFIVIILRIAKGEIKLKNDRITEGGV